jgi:hypothetical protein
MATSLETCKDSDVIWRRSFFLDLFWYFKDRNGYRLQRGYERCPPVLETFEFGMSIAIHVEVQRNASSQRTISMRNNAHGSQLLWQGNPCLATGYGERLDVAKIGIIGICWGMNNFGPRKPMRRCERG